MNYYQVYCSIISIQKEIKREYFDLYLHIKTNTQIINNVLRIINSLLYKDA